MPEPGGAAINIKGVSRPLGKAERFYWLYDLSSCTNFVVIAEISGRLDEGAASTAWKVLRERHPLLRTRVGVKTGGRVVYEPSPEAVIPMEIRPFKDGGWRSETERQLDLPFPVGSFPLLRVVSYPRSAPEGSVILFTFSHAITDAVAGIRLARDFLSIAAGDKQGGMEPPRASLPPLEEIFPPEQLGFGSYLRLARLLGQELRGRLKRGSSESPGKTRGGSPRRLNLVPLELDREQTEALVRRCRAERTTVHGIICAAQLAAIRNEFPAARRVALTVSSAVNLRGRLSLPVDNHDLGMYVSMIPVSLQLGGEVNIWNLARECRTELESKIQRGDAFYFWKHFPPSWLFPPDARGARRLGKIIASSPPMTIVTNLGLMEGESKHNSFSLESLRFAMAPQTGCPLVTAADSFAGRLFLCCTFNAGLLEGFQIEKISKTIKTYLTAAIL